MRILIRCEECSRKYDATRFEIGSRFRCRCGSELTVETPVGHDARVVRCSSCGGPREGKDATCTHCGADFTLHERDLHTVCPGCLARVSDRAKFCSQCGHSLHAEAAAGESVDGFCPSCEINQRLVSRTMGEAQVNVLECQVCVGLWLGIDSFILLRDRVRPPAGGRQVRQPTLPQIQPDSEKKQATYRKCVICERLMHRRSYGRGSGVTLDVCRDHGIWFDDGELKQALDWIQMGGWPDNPLDASFRANEMRRKLQSNPATRESSDPSRPPIRSRPSSTTTQNQPTSDSPASSNSDFLAVLFDGLFFGVTDIFG